MEKFHLVSNHVMALMIVLLCGLVALGTMTTAKAQLVENYYAGKCPNTNAVAEDIVTFAVETIFLTNTAARAGVLRMHFHDCFVNGCDGSILIDSPSEKDAIPNLTLQGFEVIDYAKSSVELFCPGVVSCADILAIAAQVAVKQLSGSKIPWKVLTGRLDGLVSTAASTDGRLPPPTATVPELNSIFGAVGLSTEQMVTLSGAHSIGVAHCAAFQNRLTNPPDPTLDPTYAVTLNASCPAGSTNVVPLDVTTPTTLDEVYYKNLQVNKGLLTSDQNLWNDESTRTIVAENTYFPTFASRFSSAMIAMGNIGIKTGSNGNIRSNCRKFNA